MLSYQQSESSMSPTACVVGAIVCAAIGAWFVAAAISPTIRKSFRWGEDGDGPRLSSWGASAWALNSTLWGFALLAAGLDWTFIEYHTLKILFGGFAVLAATAIYDGLRRREPIQPPEPMRTKGPHGSP